MYTTIKTSTRTSAKTAAFVCLVFSGAKSLHADDRATDKKHAGVLTQALKRPEFKAAAGDTAVFTDPKGQRFIVLGLGDSKKLNGRAVRKAAGKLHNALDAMDVAAVEISINAGVTKKMPTQEFGRALGEGIGIASFKFDDYKKLTATKSGKDAKSRARKKTLTINTTNATTTKGIAHGLKLASSTNFARRLAATPV